MYRAVSIGHLHAQDVLSIMEDLLYLQRIGAMEIVFGGTVDATKSQVIIKRLSTVPTVLSHLSKPLSVVFWVFQMIFSTY